MALKPRTIVRALIWLVPLLAIIIGAVYAFRPQPVPVEIGRVARGEMEVSVVEDGRTRIRDRYAVSSPVGGRLLRIGLRPGDEVTANETLLALIEPSSPALLDARETAAAEARVEAARLAVQRAEARRDQARIAMDLAESQMARILRLAETRAVTTEERESAEANFRSRSEEHRAAQFDLQIAEFELRQAEAALLHITGESGGDGGELLFEIRPPISGRVLNVFEESATVVAPGTQLLQLGDPRDLEVVVDVLSSDAVRIAPGNSVWLEQWGGEQPLEGVVRLIEPAAFTKISALGVEEQRVNVIVDLVSPVEDRQSLGDGFRVEARIIVWHRDDVLLVPTGALFRSNGQWSVFVVQDGMARRQTIEIGQRNPRVAEVLAGLEAGDQVILHPSDRVDDGVAVDAP